MQTNFDILATGLSVLRFDSSTKLLSWSVSR